MAAPNAQPAGSRPGPASVHEHDAHDAGMPSKGPVGSGPGQGVAPHGTPAPVGNGKSNPLR
jgi:hypothetical protein